MANLVIAHAGLSDGAVLTAGSEAATLPVQNLQVPQQSKRWRSVGLSNLYVVIDLMAAQAIRWVALIGHNGSGAATWRIRGATSEANLTAAPGHDSDSISMWTAAGKPAEAWAGLPSLYTAITAAAQTYRWWRIDLSDAGNPAGYFEAGRLIVAGDGPAHSFWQPGRNHTIGSSIVPIDRSAVRASVGGQLYGTPRPVAMALDLTIEYLTEADMLGNGYEIDRLRGTGRDIMACLDPAATTHLHRKTVLGHMSELTPIALAARPAYYAKRYRIQESPA